MDPTNATGGGQGAAGTQGAQGGDSTQGNDKLQQSFQQAITQASQTLSISVNGQAQLNALRARPN